MTGCLRMCTERQMVCLSTWNWYARDTGELIRKYPFEYMEVFQQYEKMAQSANKGLWGEPEPEATSGVVSDETVYVTKSGRKYHLESCRWGNISIPLSEAKNRYKPCRRCIGKR